jgi:glucan phosphoethanolaminetransferase (alkaline phosphatase superfamily)
VLGPTIAYLLIGIIVAALMAGVWVVCKSAVVAIRSPAARWRAIFFVLVIIGVAVVSIASNVGRPGS